MANFKIFGNFGQEGQFWTVFGQMVKIIKSAWNRTFFSHLQTLSVKFQKKVMNSFQEKALRMDERTHERTHATPKVSNDRWSRNQKWGD